jgi:hypothetical protein
MTRGQLSAICRLLELTPIGTSNFLKLQVCHSKEFTFKFSMFKKSFFLESLLAGKTKENVILSKM